MARSRFTGLLAVSIAVLALAGCSSAATGTGSTHSATPADARKATANPKPAPKPTGPPLGDFVFGPDGFGDITLLKAVPSTTYLAHFDDTYCVTHAGISKSSKYAGAWQANYFNANYKNQGGPSDAFFVVVYPQTRAGLVYFLWDWVPGILTATGIHVGSTLSEVEAAYPHPSAIEHGDYSEVYVIDGRIGKLMIEIAGSDSTAAEYYPGQTGTVLWMGAISPGNSVAPVAETDSIPEPCITVDDE